MLKLETFVKINPKCKNAKAFVDAINKHCKDFGIDTVDRLSMFMAQASHETGHFTAFTENLNYSDVGLANTWPNRFAAKDAKGVRLKVNGRFVPNDLAKSLHRNPQQIANHVYADRLGNGSPASGDGWKFRGHGIFQLTGKANYQAFQASGLDTGKKAFTNPSVLAQPEEAVISAMWFWKKNSLNRFADRKDIVGCSKAINGGTIGLEDRKKLYKQFSGETWN